MYWPTLLIFVLVSLVPVARGVCDTGWIPDQLYCYFLSSSPATFDEANDYCTSQKANLTYIDDDSENGFIWRNGPAIKQESFFIGYRRVAGSIWRWVATGSAGSFRKWDIGEPDGEGSCARLTPYSSAAWRDWQCTSPLYFVCKRYADCGLPPPMPYATSAKFPEGLPLDLTVYPRGTRASYLCDNGFEYMDGSNLKVTTCSVGGVWSPNLIAVDPCAPKQCLPPPTFLETISNRSATDRAFGTVVSYRCTDGHWFNQYEFNITKYIYCANDKTWKGDNVTDCEKVLCVRPVTSHAKADTPLNSFGITAVYECQTGYTYPDRTTVKTFYCGKSGWEPPPQRCEVLKCPKWSVEGAVANPSDTTDYGTTVVWTCKAGMRFPDTTTRKTMVCTIDEVWNVNITDSCQRKRCLGPPPKNSSTVNHDWLPGAVYTYGMSLNYSCKPHLYFTDGSTSRAIACGEDGLWNPSVISECVGDVLTVAIGVTHAAVDQKGADTIGTVAMFIVVGLVVGIIVLDALTFGKHFQKLRNNLCGKKTQQDEEKLVTHPQQDKVPDTMDS